MTNTISIICLCITDGTGKSRLSRGGNVPNTIGGTFLSRSEAYPNAQSNYGIGISRLG